MFWGQGIQWYQFELVIIYHSLLYTCICKLSRQILDLAQHFEKECLSSVNVLGIILTSYMVSEASYIPVLKIHVPVYHVNSVMLTS